MGSSSAAGSPPLGDPVFGEEIGKMLGQPYDLLLGRRTYDIFAANWPYAEGGSYDDIATTFNRVTKYVATRKGADLTRKGSVALRDGAKDVAKLKQEDGPALLSQGSTKLVHALQPHRKALASKEKQPAAKDATGRS